MWDDGLVCFWSLTLPSCSQNNKLVVEVISLQENQFLLS